MNYFPIIKVILINQLFFLFHFFTAMPPCEKSTMTFQSLRIRLINLLINALQVETESTNTHMLLGK